MQKKWEEFKVRLLEINDLESASAVLHWDQSTYMPQGGGEARGRQMATLGKLAHEKLIDPAMGKLLEELEPECEGLSYDSDDASLVRATRRNFEKANRIPSSFQAEMSAHFARSYGAWVKARPENDFSAVQPFLEKSLDLSRRLSEYFAPYEHIADPLIDFYDYGMKTSLVQELFQGLREKLVPLVEKIMEKSKEEKRGIKFSPGASFDESHQLAFSKKAIHLLGYDSKRGRQDKTPHPFMIRFSTNDVRITTRVREDDLTEALFSSIHEAGHAMYEQGIHASLDGTPLAEGTSNGVHESQSRLWENMVARSYSFWKFLYPQLQKAFYEPLQEISLNQFYRLINKVEKSLIRTDADEVTYNLHVMIRFGLELDLLEGKLSVADLPEAWRERYKQDLGIAPREDKNGVLQDVHWYAGTIGGSFQGYTLGNVLSAQFFEKAVDAHPKIPEEISKGTFSTLLGWLRENIYQHGSKYTAPELIEKVIGGPLSIDPYIRYLQKKYGEIYSIQEF